MINNQQPSSSSSYSKLNKSANNINTSLVGAVQNPNIPKKKESTSASGLSKSMINNFVKANNMSPNNKKLIEQMVK